MVNFDIYARRYSAGAPGTVGVFEGYININDPSRTVAQGGHFAVYFPGTDTFELVNTYLLNGRNGVIDVMDGASPTGVHLDRVNNRGQFPIDSLPIVPGVPFTPVYANYPVNWNDLICHHNETLVPDPADPDPANPTLPLVPRFSDDVIVAHNQRLTPSFNISEGQGFSFRYGGNYFHFLWVNGQFYFFVEDVLSRGSIHEFHLEYYSFAGTFTNVPSLGQSLNYFTQNIPTNTIASGAQNVLAPVERGHVYVFTGVEQNGVDSIPIAPNFVGGNFVYHTLPARMAAENARLEPTAPRPVFNTDPLNMIPRPYQIYPAATPSPEEAAVIPEGMTSPSVGMDMRFNLPALFDETSGQFNRSLMTYPTLGQALDIRMDVRVGGGTTIENFIVDFALSDVLNYTPGGSGTNSTLIVENNPRINVIDVSRLQRLGQTTAQADRVRVHVGGLAPSIAYEEVFIMVRQPIPPPGAPPVLTNFLAWPETRVATPQRPFYTFLRYTIVEVVGNMFIRVEPFNFSVGRIRTGWYMLESPQPLGFAPQNVGNVLRHIYFPLPDMLAGEPPEDRQFWITKYENNPIGGGGGHALWSQIIVWGPDRTATIGLPRNFEIRNTLVRPVQGDLHRGLLTYQARWDIGSWRDLRDLLGAGTNAATTGLEVEYILGLSTRPETMLTYPGHREYMRIPMEIRNSGTLAPPGTITGSVPGENVNFYMPEIFIHPGQFISSDLNPVVPGSYGNPITNSGEWMPLQWRVDPSTGQTVFFVEVNIRTDTLRRYRPGYPPPWTRQDFHFPGLYYMNVRVENWLHIVDGVRIPQVTSLAWSLFDYIVLDDISEVQPPPPTDFRVTAGVDRHSPPELRVQFGIPFAAIRGYLNTIYEVGVQVTTNIYIGQYEAAIMGSFYSGEDGLDPDSGQSLHPTFRPQTVALNIPFASVASYVVDAETGDSRIELDLSAPNIQRILRGETTHVNGVVRITDVPVIRGLSATPAALRLPGEGINLQPNNGWNAPRSIDLNYSILEFEQFMSIGDFTGLPMRFPVYAQDFTIIGLDINTRYFLFADLEIEMFVEERDANNNRTGIWQPRRDQDGALVPPTVSVFTGIVADTTIGQVIVPDPSYPDPTAPENIGARDIGEMEATIYWDFKEPQPGEEDFVAFEWEIIRILDGTRLTPSQMTAHRDESLETFLRRLLALRANEDVNFDLHDVKAWRTDEYSLDVLRWTAAVPNLTTIRIEDPSAPVAGQTQRYHWDPSIVELSDFTLLPNNLYFYYVRTVRIVEIYDEQLGPVLSRRYSVWVEQPVTTSPVQPPMNLRQEPGEIIRITFDPTTESLMSWEHPEMTNNLEKMGTNFLFRYQLRYAKEPWCPLRTVPV